ncbi:MAG: DUF427 domain-containing protein [Paracoccaceae bacterium]
MAEPIIITPAPGRYRVRVGDFAIGETDKALVLDEAGHDPVIYVPRADMNMAVLEPAMRHTTCPWKGEASYFSVLAPSGRLNNAVWTYDAPIPGRSEIAGHLAFYPSVTVEPV